MIVYGDPQYTETLGTLVAQLQARLAALCAAPPGERPLDALRTLLIAAGQVEQGVIDSPPGSLAPPVARGLRRRLHAATRHAAVAFYATWAGGQPATHQATTGRALAAMTHALTAVAAQAPGDPPITVKIPEGFAFYALYPEQYCAAAQRWLADHAAAPDRRALVVGIRSIGTSLAAVVAATLAAHGWTVHHLTVRPTGHPFARRVALPPRQMRQAAWGLVVDEGPGLSGSSMAATGAALERAGLARERISFFPGHGGDPGSAASDDVRAWWAATPRYVVPLSDVRFQGKALPDALAAAVPDLGGADDPVGQIEDLGGGGWRRVVYSDPAQWPAVCAPFERPKYRVTLQSGRQFLCKYAGLALGPGPHGTSADAEATLLAERAAHSGGPAPLGLRHGFLALPWLDGTPLTRTDATPALLAHIGRTIAQVAGPPLPPAEAEAALARLRDWLYWNTWEALGDAAATRARQVGARLAADSTLPRYGDGHLAPHEWLRTPTGAVIKVDSTGHVHDHTIVGPQPVAWDVAGAWVEWGLDTATAAPLLTAYYAAGGTPLPPPILHAYRLAYAAFRLGQCHLCAAMTSDPADATRLGAAFAFYRAALEQGLGTRDEGRGTRYEGRGTRQNSSTSSLVPHTSYLVDNPLPTPYDRRMHTPDPLAARRAEFRFSHPIAVRFNDFDLLGHVNNAVYLTFCEAARFAYLTAVGGDIQQSDLNLILAHISIDYRRPVGWGETVRIDVRTVAVGTKSFTMEYLILGTTGADLVIAAEARSVQVAYDYTAGRSAPVLPAFVAALEAFEGRPLRG